ncbi:MAG TPA: DNA polymerase III subunit delta [Candidatus Saccharimonadales bacterium]|nr:DNA polymerase III subunit delta [Candidatus Saccharimonadales bacterium]
MIISLTGPNNTNLKRRLDELVERFTAQHGELSIERIDAEGAEPDIILSSISNLPFLTSAKLVILRGLGTNSWATDKIEQIISSIPTEVDLIILESSPDKRTAYFKVLKSKTRLEEFNELPQELLPKWLTAEAESLGAKLDLGTARYLVDRVGVSQTLLISELEKLVLHNRTITKESIDLLTEKRPQSRIFDLLDAMFSGNQKKALTLYEEQRAQKVEPQAILALIVWQLQLIAIAKSAGGRPAGQIASEAKLNPYPLNKAKSLAGKLEAAKLKQIIGLAAEADYKSKVYAVDLDEALKNLIVGLK